MEVLGILGLVIALTRFLQLTPWGQFTDMSRLDDLANISDE